MITILNKKTKSFYQDTYIVRALCVFVALAFWWMTLYFSFSSQSDDSDSLSSKPGWPRGYKIKQRNRAHHLIEEWMLAANQAVARRLFHQVIRQKHREILNSDNSLTTKAGLTVVGLRTQIDKPREYRQSSMGTVLRRHPAPQPIKMDELVRSALILVFSGWLVKLWCLIGFNLAYYSFCKVWLFYTVFILGNLVSVIMI